jgi:hypothetical protein
MKKRIIIVQEELKKRGLYSDDIDGIAGSGTESALNKIPGLDNSWNISRKIHGFIQLLCQENGISPGDIDGYWGSETEHALNQYLYLRENGKLPDPWRPEEQTPVNPYNWPVQYTPGFDSFYGPKGANLVKLQLPYPHRLSWDLQTTINSFSCHKKVHDSMKRVLSNVHNHYGPDKIRELRLDLWGGCYNERPLRGGTKWSMHSWGIAVDFDPGRNKLDWGRDKASFAQPVYNKWWQFWEDEGWLSLGRERNFDWMHMQAAKL